MNKNELKEWAETEVELYLKQHENEEKETAAALKTFNDFLDRAEDLENIGSAGALLIRLLLEENLAPIEDMDEIWEQSLGLDPSNLGTDQWFSMYQCKRRGSLFKRVAYNSKTGLEKINYSDLERAACVDIQTGQMYRPENLELCVLDEVDPIQMPYQPSDKIKIFVDRFRYYEDSQDFDTMGIPYIQKPGEQPKEVGRWFKKNLETGRWEEIRKIEYFGRKRRVEERSK